MRYARMLIAALAFALGAWSSTAHAGQTLEAFTSTVFQQQQSSFSGIGLRMRIHPSSLAEGFSIAPSIEYWRNHSKLESFDIETTRKDATLTGLLCYDMKHEGWQPYFGLGLGIHFLGNEVDAPAQGLVDESNTLIKGGMTLLGGVHFGLAGKLGNVLEAEFHYIPPISQLKANWGLSYQF